MLDKEPRAMVIMCRKCQDTFSINPTSRYKIEEMDCPFCGEESYQNFLLQGHDKKITLDVDQELKKQRIEKDQ